MAEPRPTRHHAAMPATVTVWAVELGPATPPAEIRGRLALASDALVFSPGDEGLSESWLGQEVAPAPRPDFLVDDGDDVEIPGVELRVLHTPGHTQGSISIYGGGMLFSGDTLFRGSIGRTDLPGGDFEQIIRSIADRLLPLPDETIVLPGHMQETTIGAERAENPFILQELARRRDG